MTGRQGYSVAKEKRTMSRKHFLVFLIGLLLVVAAEDRMHGACSSLQSETKLPEDKAFTDDPPPTLVSGEERVFGITVEDPMLVGAGRFKPFRYGAVSDGPVTIAVSSVGPSWVVKVFDREGNPLHQARGGNKESSSFTVEMKAGEEIRLLLALGRPETVGELRITLTEENRVGGEKAINEAIERAKALLAKSGEEKKAGNHEKARESTREALDVLDNVPGCSQNQDAMDVLWDIGDAASDLEDQNCAYQAQNAVRIFRESTLHSEHPRLQAARGNLALTVYSLGDLGRARALLEQVLAVYQRTLPRDHPNMLKVQENLAIVLGGFGDYEGKRELLERVIKVHEQTLSPDHLDLQTARMNLAIALIDLNDYQEARALLEKALDVYERTLPPNHSEMQKVRLNLAVTLRNLGDLQGARKLDEKVIEIYEQTVSPDHPALQTAKMNLALTLSALGDTIGSRALLEDVVEVRERTLPSDHPNLQQARVNLSATLIKLKDYHGARTHLEQVLEVRERTLPPDHPHLQIVRGNLALIKRNLGDLEGARTLGEKVLEVCERTLPPEHPNRQRALRHLIATLKKLGELKRACLLQEKLLIAREQTLPPDHPEIQNARLDLAIILTDLGDLHNARLLEEMVVEAHERTLPPDHPDLQNARCNLAASLSDLGDPHGARSLLEKVLEVAKRTLPVDHPSLQLVRMNLAVTLTQLDDYSRAQELLQDVLEVWERTLPGDHPDLQLARANLAGIMSWNGDFQNAKLNFEKVLEVYKRTLPPDHPELLKIWGNLAMIERGMGNLSEAQAHLEKVLKEYERIHPPDHPDVQTSRSNLIVTLLDMGQHEKAVPLIQEALHGAIQYISSFVEAGSVREIDEIVRESRYTLDRYLSFGLNGSFSSNDCFVATEAFRAAGARAGLIRRIIAREGGGRIRTLINELTSANRDIASAPGTAFTEAVRKRDKLERMLAEAVAAMPGAKDALGDKGVEEILAALPERWMGVSYLRYNHKEYHKEKTKGISTTPSYLAFVLRRPDHVDIIELGPAVLIDEAINTWREVLYREGAPGDTREVERSAGRVIYDLIWDPLREMLCQAERVVVAPDSVMATIPLEAVPEGDGVLADRLTIAYVDSFTFLALGMGELWMDDAGLVAFGGIDYDASPKLYRQESSHKGSAEISYSMSIDSMRSAPRGRADIRAMPLEGTGIEVREISELYRKTAGREALLIDGASASKASLVALAPRAKYLHIATHGYFAPDRIKSILDSEIDEGNNFIFSTMEERISGLAPSLLCGLKLSGCNLARDGFDDPCVITAEEIQGIDLSNCELAVLSACESNVGLIRAGQGIMSLQRAIGIAGAHGSITSLWKVNDQATRLFFIEFYRLLWEEKMEPPEALRETRLWLRGLTLAEVRGLLAGVPVGEIRGVRKRIETTDSKEVYPYDFPRFWASFVYWGRVR